MKKILFFFLLLVVFFSFKTIDVQSAACSLATTPYASPASGTTGSKIKLYWHNQACDYVDLYFKPSGSESFIVHDAQSGYEITMTSPGPETYAIKAYSYSACSPGLNAIIVDAQSGLLLCQTQTVTVKPLPLVNFLVNGKTSTIGTPTSYQTFSGSVIGMVGCDMMAYGPDDPSQTYKNMGGVGVSGDGLPLNFSNQNGLFTPYSDGGFNFTLICSDGTGLPSGIIRKSVYVDFSTPVTAPNTPTGLSVTPSTCGNNWLNLSWNVSTGATSYKVYRDGSLVTLTGYSCGATSCVGSDTGLVLGSNHSYTVTASNTGGTSSAAGPVSGTVSSACVHTITFNGNTNTGGSMANQSIADNTSANLTLNGFTKTGYTFANWNTALNGSGTSYANGASFPMGTSNVTLYAQWTLITTATINVTSNVSTGWCINATTCDTAKTTKTYTVTPGVTGSSYTIVGNTVNNYTGPTITNNVTGSGSTFILFPGDSGTFSLSYTPVGNPPCTTCNGGGFDYSLEGPASKVVTKGVPEQIVLTAKLINTPAQTISFEVSGNPAGISIQPTQCIPAWTPTCTSNINIFVDQSVALGKYTITIKGSPLANKLYKFDLDVISGGGGGGLSVTSCKADPLIQAWIGQIVKWSVVYSGGTPPYQFRWTGPGMKNDSAWLSADTYELTYSTTGKKSASVEVKDSAGSLKSVDCDASSIQIKVNPTFKEQ